MKFILCSLTLFLASSQFLPGQNNLYPRWEYLVISTDEIATSITESGQEEAYMEWLAANRPAAHRTITELESKSASADNARKKLKSLISNVSNSRTAFLATMDFYLNRMGMGGWELISHQDSTLIFKRPSPPARPLP